MTGMSPDIFQVKTGTRPQCFPALSYTCVAQYSRDGHHDVSSRPSSRLHVPSLLQSARQSYCPQRYSNSLTSASKYNIKRNNYLLLRLMNKVINAFTSRLLFVH